MELSTSISNSISKGEVQEEFSLSLAALEDAKNRRPESISNEQIQKGDKILETYTVLDEAIHGGMGSVWCVHHESWNVDLAMKRPQPRFFAEGSDRRKEEFIKECENWINLGLHPNIVSCYYVRDIGGVPTIFSEWMDNGSLKDRIQDGSLYKGTEKEVQKRILDIVIQAARGLSYSHKNSLIHQDMKPGNLLLTKKWEAKVADFGLAKAQSQLSDANTSGSLGYTLAYCPKEQAEGTAAEKWMDVYAWGLTVLEMYAGRRLWNTGAEAKEHCGEYFDQCRIPPSTAIQEVLKKALNREDLTFDVLFPSLMEIWQVQTGSAYPRQETLAASDTSDSLNNRALSFLDLGMKEKAAECWDSALTQDSAHVPSVYNQGLYQWRGGSISSQEILRRVRMAVQTQPLPFEYLQKQIRAEQADTKPVLIEKRLGWQSCAFRSDGRRVWSVSSFVTCYDAETLQILYQRECEGSGSDAFLSPDGKFLLYRVTSKGPEKDRRLRVLEAETGKLLSILEQSEQITAKKVRFHPDKRHCIILGSGRTEYATAWKYFLQKWDLLSGKQVLDIDLRFKDIKQALGIEPLELTVPADICLTPDGSTVYAAVNSGNTFIAAYGIQTGALLGPIYTITFSVDVLCFSPDGQKLYAAGKKGIAVWDVSTHRGKEFEATLNENADMLFSSEGDKLYASGQYGVTVWNTADMTMDLLSVPGGVSRLWLDGDGSHLISADHNEDGAIRLWDLKTGACLQSFQGHKGKIWAISATEDLSFLLSLGGDRNLFKWNARSRVRYAPWELCRMKTFEEQQALTKAVSDTKWSLFNLVHTPDKVGQAITELAAAEKKYGQHLFLEVRRELIKSCISSKVTDIYEMSSFPVADEYSGDSGAYSQTPYPVPGCNYCVITEPESKYFYIYSEEGRRRAKLDLPPHFYGISNHLCFSGFHLYAAGSGIIEIWDTARPVKMDSLSIRVHEALPFPENGNVKITLSPDARFLLSAWDSGNFCLWESSSSFGLGRYHKRREWKAESDENIRQISFSPDGKTVGILDEAGNLSVMNPFTGEILKTITENPEETDDLEEEDFEDENPEDWEDSEEPSVIRFCFTPSGDYLYVSEKEEVSIWNTGTWEKAGCFHSYKDDCRGDLCFSSDGSLMATYGNTGVRIWSVPEHTLIHELKGLTSQIDPEEAIFQKILAFSSDGCILYVGTGNFMHTFVIRRELTPKPKKIDYDYLKKVYGDLFDGKRIPTFQSSRCPQCGTHRVSVRQWDREHQLAYVLCEECGWDGWKKYELKELE